MAKTICILLTILLSTTTILAREKTCSPWLGYCLVYEHCCRHLQCASYLNKCIPKGGLVIPGQDKRPIGPGPYPPKQVTFYENI